MKIDFDKLDTILLSLNSAFHIGQGMLIVDYKKIMTENRPFS